MQLAVGNRYVEAVADVLHILVAELFGLVHGVLALAGLAHAIALDGLDQQHARLPTVGIGRMEGGVHLLGIMAAAAQIPDFLVRHVLHEPGGLGVLAKEVLAHIGPVVGLERLVVAVERFHHQLAQPACGVAGEQRIPVAAPDELDHVPARATEFAFELLDDLAVATHRAIEPLEVAVDDEDEVVQPLARCQADGSQALRLVHLAVAAENPHLAVGRVGNAACMQVLQEPCLVDGHQRPEAHADRGKLPEVMHQLGMRVARQTMPTHFLPEVVELLLGQAPLQKGPRIDARCAVPLNVDAVAAMGLALGVPEMVEARPQHGRQRGKRPDMPPQIPAIFGMQAVGPHHHGHGVPAHVGTQPLFDGDIAGATRLLLWFKRVDVAGRGGERHVDAVLARVFEQLFEQEMCPVLALVLDHA